MRRQIDRVVSILLSFERSEVVFAAAAVGLAIVVGFVQPAERIAWQILIVIWSALVGMMISRIVHARRSGPEPAARDFRTVSHDIASSLLMIEGGVTALRYMHRDHEAAHVESVAHAIEVEIRRIRRLSATGQSARAASSLAETIEPLVELHQANGAVIRVDLRNAPNVAIAPDDLARVVANLLDNCARHAPGAHVTIEGRPRDGCCSVAIRDDGPGITLDLVDGAADRGVSSRPGGGLGLYIVRSIVESAGGTLSIRSDDRGTTVLVMLPVAGTPTGTIDTPSSLSTVSTVSAP